jgi:hypothetical protein
MICSPGRIIAVHRPTPSRTRIFGAPKNVTAANTASNEIKNAHAPRRWCSDRHASIGISAPIASSVTDMTGGMPRANAATPPATVARPSTTARPWPIRRGASEAVYAIAPTTTVRTANAMRTWPSIAAPSARSA